MTPQEFKAARLRFGLTQVEMAALLGYRHGMRVSVMERGAEPVPYQTAMLIRLLLDPTWRPQGWPRPLPTRPKLDRAGRIHRIRDAA
jgi:hypothetical protein